MCCQSIAQAFMTIRSFYDLYFIYVFLNLEIPSALVQINNLNTWRPESYNIQMKEAHNQH